MKLALPMLLILGLSGCKASLNAEAKASASGSGARAGGDADAEASLTGNGDEARPQDDLDKPIDAQPSQQIVETQAQGPALLGARRDLSYNGPKTETCSCLAVKLGPARDAAFQWEKQPPLLDDSRQLVVGLTSQGVSCAQEAGLGASYKGYVRSGNDIVVMVERAHEGRPVQSGAIVPRPVATGQVYVVAAEKGSPFGGAVGNPKERCRLELPATSQLLAVEAGEAEAAALADVPGPEDDEADPGASQDFLEVDEAVLDGDGEPSRSPRERDGFFLSLQPAVDYMHLSQRGADAAFSGFGFGLDFMIGGSVAEGFHLGVILGGAAFPSPDLKVQGATIPNDIDLNWFHVGGAIDYYFSPDSGTHLLGEVGYAQLTASGTRAESQNFLGLGLALGLGHDWWISDNWSLGLLARFSFAPLHHRQADTDHLLFLPGLHFTATYH